MELTNSRLKERITRCSGTHENRASLAAGGYVIFQIFILNSFSLYTEFLPPALLSLLPHSQYQPITQENIFDHPKCY